MNRKKTFSIVIPVFNEQDNVSALIDEIAHYSKGLSADLLELVLVDDGSTDNIREATREAFKRHPEIPLRCIRLGVRSGKSNALALGFRRLRGDYLVTMDGDLQDDPAELQRMIDKLEQGFDMVSGWKKNRRDPISKRLPSAFLNWVMRKVYNIPLHDFNCGFKIYRKDALRHLKIYGDLYRFIPLFLSRAGFRLAEIEVNHRERKFGSSKFGLGRLFTGALDFLTVLVITRFVHNPGHLFGGIGVILGLVGFLILSYLGALWCLALGPIGNRPLFFLGILAVLLSAQFIFFGVLAEMIVQIVSRSTNSVHIIEEIANSPRTLPLEEQE